MLENSSTNLVPRGAKLAGFCLLLMQTDKFRRLGLGAVGRRR